MVIISGSSNPSLTKKIAKKGRLVQVPVEISKFPNGEKKVYDRVLWLDIGKKKMLGPAKKL